MKDDGKTAQGQEQPARKSSRFIIEGEWSGYTSSQQHVVHRQVYPGSFKKLRAWADRTHAIYYTDGTALYLSVRDCQPRERVEQIKGYTSLIEKCAYHNVNSVAALHPSRATSPESSDDAPTSIEAK